MMVHNLRTNEYHLSVNSTLLPTAEYSVQTQISQQLTEGKSMPCATEEKQKRTFPNMGCSRVNKAV